MAAYDSGNISGYNIYAPVCIDEPNGNYYPSSYVRAILSLCFIRSYKIISVRLLVADMLLIY
jgi:hypothetical protein